MQIICSLESEHYKHLGRARGYRMGSGRSDMHPFHDQIPHNPKHSEFARSHLVVTRPHDNEAYTNSTQNIYLPLGPQQDFSKFFRGESVGHEDIVNGFHLGMHQFTRSEDVPVTLYTEAYSSIAFALQNFFNQAQDGDLLKWPQMDESR